MQDFQEYRGAVPQLTVEYTCQLSERSLLKNKSRGGICSPSPSIYMHLFNFSIMAYLVKFEVLLFFVVGLLGCYKNLLYIILLLIM